ncbi:hypothetical protein K9U40_13865 [Xanthobacter autotrophicus]|uniref:hypothetical protein n=1 Tax=Xanthobacter TaxID=279 RepID=UPI0024AC7378|nr:hypothetical protein [Xanthobacter autotrophicus]MDI4665407.1 hypothetical protein [Xanthobacter autotrophicus]
MNQRAQKRRLERLALKNEATIASDRRFFERRPDRQYRLRLASAAEVDLNRALSSTWADPGGRLFVVVRRISHTVRIRALFFGPAENAADMDNVSEAEAAFLFQRARRQNAQLAGVERSTVEAFGGAA